MIIKQSIQDKIEALPPLPQTLIKLQEFKKQPIKEIEDLAHILEQDPLVVASILKVANSSLFGFRNKVETVKRAIGLLGIDFVISFVFFTLVKQNFNISLDCYKLSSEAFIQISNLMIKLAQVWLKKANYGLTEEIMLPALLQNTGQFIIAQIAKESGKEEDFYKLITVAKVPVSIVEKKMTGYTSSEISAAIFEKWNLDKDLINTIKYVDNIDNCPEEYLFKSEVLNIVKTACNLDDPLGEQNIMFAESKLKKYNFSITPFELAVEEIKTKILENS